MQHAKTEKKRLNPKSVSKGVPILYFIGRIGTMSDFSGKKALPYRAHTRYPVLACQKRSFLPVGGGFLRQSILSSASCRGVGLGVGCGWAICVAFGFGCPAFAVVSFAIVVGSRLALVFRALGRWFRLSITLVRVWCWFLSFAVGVGLRLPLRVWCWIWIWSFFVCGGLVSFVPRFGGSCW